MISVESMYSEILSQTVKDLPLSVNRVGRRRVSAQSAASSGSAVNNTQQTAASKGNEITFEQMLENFTSSGAVRLLNPSTEGSASSQIETAIRAASEKYDVDYALIKGVIKAESSFNPNTVSSAGAQGLMQLMPSTARSLGVLDPFSIEQNIDGGTKYLKQMIDRFNGNISLALAAYNAGPGNVEKYGGIPPFEETRNYVPRVLANAQMYENE